MNLDFGYRSQCCYAPVRIGFRKLKNSNKKYKVWVCVKCKKRDVVLVDYKKRNTSQSSDELDDTPRFVPEE